MSLRTFFTTQTFGLTQGKSGINRFINDIFRLRCSKSAGIIIIGFNQRRIDADNARMNRPQIGCDVKGNLVRPLSADKEKCVWIIVG